MPRKKIEVDPECGMRLKSWLKSAGISQARLCEAIHYSQPYISDVVSGRRRMTRELAIEIERADLGLEDNKRVSAIWLLDGGEFISVEKSKQNAEAFLESLYRTSELCECVAPQKQAITYDFVERIFERLGYRWDFSEGAGNEFLYKDDKLVGEYDAGYFALLQESVYDSVVQQVENFAKKVGLGYGKRS